VDRWPNKYVIGLTGNIATGKSVVRQMLQHLGAYTIDADGLAHQAMSPGAPAYRPIVETFGQFILNPDKSINRSMLATIVFSNKDALGKLEAITHPIVGQAINTLVSRAKQPIVVIEAIKLLEGDLVKGVSAVWVVDAKPKTQYARLVGKRKMAADEAKTRMLGQNPQSEKLKAATLVIQNDGNIEDTWKQVQVAVAKLAPAPSAPPKPEPVVKKEAVAEKPVEPKKAVAAPGPAAIVGVTVRRGMPDNAEDIANFINTATGKSIGRVDIMMAFGEKSYLVASDESETTVGLSGWQVENLITCVDELYVTESPEVSNVIHALVRAIEEASNALQSEVSFIFLPVDVSQSILEPFFANGYETITMEEIKIPAWRESVQNVLEEDENRQLLTKKLRQDRVLKPM
jgi:dephospho-CoA kinase